MIPKQLKIKGLYSYIEEQTIDFSTLLRSHIFGIFGKVGSGKSTILEAISFALYGESERLNNKDKRGYNMMNLQSNELFIEFIFSAGANKSIYKSVVEGKRNRKRFEEVKSFNRSLYKKEKGEWIPIETSKIAQIIGLSYHNFKRTIIIPQGKFQEFLSLGNKDRSNMLKEIFELQKFDLSSKIGILYSRNKEQISRISGQLDQLVEVSPEILSEFKIQFKTQDKSYQVLVKKHQKDEIELKKLETVQQLFKDLVLAKSDLDSFTSKYESPYLNLEKEAKKVNYCNEHFKNLLERQTFQDKEVQQIQNNIKTSKVELENAGQELNKVKTEFQKAKENVEKKDYYQKIILDIGKTIEINQLSEEQKEKISQNVKIKNEALHFEKTITALKNEIEKAQVELTKLTKEKPNLIELIKIRDWFEIYKDLSVEIKQKKTDLAKLDARLIDIISQKEKLSIPYLDKNPVLKKNTIDELIQNFKTLQTAVEQNRKMLHVEYNLAYSQNELVEHAKNLHDGDTCPICGSIEHPKKLIGDDLVKQLKSIESKQASSEQKFKAISDVLNELSAIRSSILDLRSRTLELNKDISDVENALKEHEKTRFWKDKNMDSLEAIQKQVIQAENIQSKIDSYSKNKEINVLELKNHESNFEKIKPKLDNNEKQISQLESKIELLKSQTNPDNFIKMSPYPIDKLDKLNMQYQDKIMDNDDAIMIFDRFLKTSEAKNTSLQTTIKLLSENLIKEQAELDTITSKLEKQLQKSDFSSLKEIIDLLAQNIDPKEQLKRVEQFKKEVFSKKEKLDLLRTRTKDLSFNSDAFSLLQSTIQDQKSNIDHALGQIAKIKGKIEELTLKVKEKLSLQTKLKNLELRAENINTLSNLFKGQGFVNYISSVFLQNIIKNANHRFLSLTKHELSLELADDNSFNIRDMLNGGKIRNIKTLSGGQTFQAALSLALALADNIHELTKSKQNFFFLDEGFGTQDNESIADVFKTLKALRNENRTVGIISHVDVLQQEIDVNLTVRKDDERGSLVEESW